MVSQLKYYNCSVREEGMVCLIESDKGKDRMMKSDLEFQRRTTTVLLFVAGLVRPILSGGE